MANDDPVDERKTDRLGDYTAAVAAAVGVDWDRRDGFRLGLGGKEGEE